jgi:cytochrome P450
MMTARLQLRLVSRHLTLLAYDPSTSDPEQNMSVQIPYPIPTKHGQVLLTDLQRDYAELRKHGPVIPAQVPFGKGTCWLIMGHDEYRFVSMDRRFSAKVEGDYPRSRIFEAGPPMPKNFQNLDPPEHTARRRVIMKHLTVKTIDGLRVPTRAKVDALLAQAESSPQVDMMQGFARPLTLAVLCDWLGIPVEEVRPLVDIADAHVSASMETPEEAEASVATLKAYFESAVARARRERGEGVVSALVHDTDAGLWDAEELNGTGMNLLLAGHDSTASVLGSILFWLAHSPDLYRELQQDQTLIPRAVEEFLRVVTLGVTTTRSRVATEDVEVGGVLIRTGDHVIPVVPSANMDESVYDNAAEFILDRKAAAHVAFGAGPHACIGQLLARMEINEALTGLTSRWTSMTAAQPDPAWRDQLPTIAPPTLEVVWSK